MNAAKQLDGTNGDGVISHSFDRTDITNVRLHGIPIKLFEPLNANGSRVAVAPDFSMVAGEINAVVATMQAHGWDIGCLYNQETDEAPQLYFSHEFKTGNPYVLAREVRQGLNRMNMR